MDMIPDIKENMFRLQIKYSGSNVTVSGDLGFEEGCTVAKIQSLNCGILAKYEDSDAAVVSALASFLEVPIIIKG